MDDLPISSRDQEKIDGMVSAYRHSLEHLYRLAYLQGGMDAIDDVRVRLKAPAIEAARS